MSRTALSSRPRRRLERVAPRRASGGGGITSYVHVYRAHFLVQKRKDGRSARSARASARCVHHMRTRSYSCIFTLNLTTHICGFAVFTDFIQRLAEGSTWAWESAISARRSLSRWPPKWKAEHVHPKSEVVAPPTERARVARKWIYPLPDSGQHAMMRATYMPRCRHAYSSTLQATSGQWACAGDARAANGPPKSPRSKRPPLSMQVASAPAQVSPRYLRGSMLKMAVAVQCAACVHV